MEATALPIAALVPVYVVIAAGFAWQRFRQPFDAPLADGLVHVVGLPCLILFTFAKAEIAPAEIAAVLAAALIAYAAFAAIGWAALRLAGPAAFPGRALVLLPMTGGMALPPAALGFGAKGLALALVFMTVGAAATALAGPAATGFSHWRRLLRVPAIAALALAAALTGGGVALPAWAANTVRLLGGFVVAMQLIGIGVVLARLRPGALRPGLALACLRILAGLGVGTGLALALALDGAARAVVILQCAMPVALAPQLLAAADGAAPEPAASAFVASTALVLLALPGLYLFAA